MTKEHKYSTQELINLIISYDKTGVRGMYTSSKWVTKSVLLELFSTRRDIFFGSDPIKTKTKRTIYHLAWNKLKY